MKLTPISPKTHPELFRPGIIITNAPYRSFFYHVEKVTDPRYNIGGIPAINILSKGGIIIEKVSK